MMLAALCAFAAAAVAGIFLATRHFLRKRLPVWVALLHGLGGATGFAIVLLIVVQQPNFDLARQALYIFIVTIALGATNLLFHIRGVRHRTSLIVLHALTAVSGVLTLIYALFMVGPPEVSTATAATQTTAAPAAPAPSPTETSAAPAEAPTASAAPSDSAAPAEAKGTEAPPSTPAAASLDSIRSQLAASVSFDTKGATLASSSESALDGIAKVLKEHPEVTLVQVQGHADERGEDGANIGLTRARAAAVVEALVAKGVERSRLHAVGFGARCPANPSCGEPGAPDSCHGEASWSADRRVVFLPLKVGNESFKGEVACSRGAPLIPTGHRQFHQAK